eukprot:scaffold67585_cov63-Phaeocystis_antarctica.AAC.2
MLAGAPTSREPTSLPSSPGSSGPYTARVRVRISVSCTTYTARLICAKLRSGRDAITACTREGGAAVPAG